MESFDVRALSRRLIGDMEIQDFNCDVRERRMAKFADAIDPQVLDELYNLSRLEAGLAREEIPTPYVDVFACGQLAKLDDVEPGSGRSCLAAVVDNFRRGATIRVRDVQKFDARINHLAGEIRRFFAAQSQINVYLTPPDQTGFPPHFDNTDVFILQCIGRKDWKIFHDYEDRTELPLPDTPWEPNRYRPSAPGEDMTLGPGDVLYLPRGAMHQASCTKRESMHLTISIVPVTFADLLARELRRIAETDVGLRRRVPWSTGDGDGELDELTAQVRACAIGLVDRIDAGALLRAERRLLRADPDAASTGELESVIAGLVEQAGTD